MSPPNVWEQEDCKRWHDMLQAYPDVIAAQGSERLSRLDRWYREAFPQTLSARPEPYVLLQELQDVADWKMTRGVWRERNRQLISSNPPERVREASRKAFTEAPDLRKAINTLSELAGVGPATASAIMAAYAPQSYPFFDELVAEQIPGLGPVTFTMKYYVAYAEALNKRASELNTICTHHPWTPQDVGQAMWAASGGKEAKNAT